MKEKIRYLMKSEGLTSSRFAEILEIRPSGVSHLLAGRNKPGFELLQKILTRFPKINPDWLLLDKGEIYRDDELEVEAGSAEFDILGADFSPLQNSSPEEQPPILSLDSEATSGIEAAKEASPTSTDGEYIPSWEKSMRQEQEPSSGANLHSALSSRSRDGARATAVVVLYEDGSCESFKVR
ncbi:MAG: helix-turn-helix transcriptional regulator [Rikenellaceae bacterium]